MPGLSWNLEEKAREWTFAKKNLIQDGKLLPNGTKLRRKDHFGYLNHSFMVIDDRIIALSEKGEHLGKGHNAHTKLAEDHKGNLIALKIIKNAYFEEEARIAEDLGIAGQITSRASSSQNPCTKYYIAYRYLGELFFYYLFQNRGLSLDNRYDLSIKTALALHNLHTGKQAKSKKRYIHRDIHWGNIVIDNQKQTHFIDCGRAGEMSSEKHRVDDIVQMLLLFFAPKSDRDYRHDIWIFGEWLAEYSFTYSRPNYNTETKKYYPELQTIYVYIDSADKQLNGAYSLVHFGVCDLMGNYQEKTLSLTDLGIDDIVLNERNRLRYYDLELSDLDVLEKRIRETLDADGYTLAKKNRNHVLFNLLKDPVALYKSKIVPSALDIAGTLTLCRLGLESHQDFLKKQSTDLQFEMIHLLNAVSVQINALYDSLRLLPRPNSALNNIVKSHIVLRLASICTEKPDSTFDQWNKQLTHLKRKDACSIRKKMDDVFMHVRFARIQAIGKQTYTEHKHHFFNESSKTKTIAAHHQGKRFSQ